MSAKKVLLKPLFVYRYGIIMIEEIPIHFCILKKYVCRLAS